MNLFKKYFKKFIYIIFIPLISNSALALTGKEVSQTIVNHLSIKGYISNPAIKANRQFKECDHKLEVTEMFQDYKTVYVSCKKPLNWKIAIRTNAQPILTTKIKDMETAIIKENQIGILHLNTSLKKGEVIQEFNLAKINDNRPKGSGYFVDVKQLIGRKLKQNLSSGQIVRSRHLEQNWMIEKDQIVLIIANINGVEVEGKGKALENGHFNELIQVSNSSSGKIVEGRIINQKNIFVKF